MDTVSILVPEIDVHLKNSRQRLNFSSEGSAKLKKTKASRVPEQTRRYAHGDPTQLIDWKLYARTDQLLIREHKDDTSLNITVYLKHDATMDWPLETTLSGDISTKWEIAVRVAFHIAYQHLSHGDRVRLYVEDESKVFELKVKSASALNKYFMSFDDNFDVKKIISFLEKSEFVSNSKIDRAYILSDLLESIDFDNFSEIKEVSFKHILSSLDTNYEWINSSDFYSSSIEGNRKVKGKHLRNQIF